MVKEFDCPNMSRMGSPYDMTVWWIRTHSIMVLMGFVLSLSVGTISVILLPAGITFTWFLFVLGHSTGLPVIIGFANWITLARLLGIYVLVGSLHYLTDLHLFFGFLTIIILDGLDGFVARKYHQTTQLGEIFDGEVDAFLVLVLSLVHFKTGTLGWWIFIPGAMRYVFEIYIWIFRITVSDYPPKKVRSTIAVIFFLTLLTPFILDQTTSIYLNMVAGILIVISFCTALIRKES